MNIIRKMLKNKTITPKKYLKTNLNELPEKVVIYDDEGYYLKWIKKPNTTKDQVTQPYTQY